MRLHVRDVHKSKLMPGVLHIKFCDGWMSRAKVSEMKCTIESRRNSKTDRGEGRSDPHPPRVYAAGRPPFWGVAVGPEVKKILGKVAVNVFSNMARAIRRFENDF